MTAFLKIFDVVPGWLYAIALAVVLAGAGVQTVRLDSAKVDVANIKTERAAENLKREQEAFAEAEANAKESKRRIERQQENQRAQDTQIAVARADAARNERTAEQLRDQNASTARQWRDALADSPAGSKCAAAGDAIVLSADVLGRADRRAGELASYADAARIAGLKCEADYSSLTAP